jgi:hypothetical protein
MVCDEAERSCPLRTIADPDKSLILANSIPDLSLHIQVTFQTGETGVPLRSLFTGTDQCAPMWVRKISLFGHHARGIAPRPTRSPTLGLLMPSHIGCVGKALRILAAEMTVLHDTHRHPCRRRPTAERAHGVLLRASSRFPGTTFQLLGTFVRGRGGLGVNGCDRLVLYHCMRTRHTTAWGLLACSSLLIPFGTHIHYKNQHLFELCNRTFCDLLVLNCPPCPTLIIQASWESRWMASLLPDLSVLN